MTVRPLSWACGHETEMLLILKKLFLTWLLRDIFRYDSPKKCPTILYAVNLWLKPVSATGAILVSSGQAGLSHHTLSFRAVNQGPLTKLRDLSGVPHWPGVRGSPGPVHSVLSDRPRPLWLHLSPSAQHRYVTNIPRKIDQYSTFLGRW